MHDPQALASRHLRLHVDVRLMLQQQPYQGFMVILDSHVQGCPAILHAPVANEKMGVRGTRSEGDGDGRLVQG